MLSLTPLSAGNVGAANGGSVRTGGPFAFNFKLAPLRFAKKGNRHSPARKLTAQTQPSAWRRQSSVSQSALPFSQAGVFESKGNFSTLSEYTFTKYR
jgi:hypothetical protein